jgi:ribosomal protein S18 acetylase RimI-like enzyme
MSRELDNPIWHALTGPHRDLATGTGLARHYPRDMAPFAAIENKSAAAYADLARGLPADTEARLFRPTDEELPDGWLHVDAFPMLQMVATHAPSTSAGAGVPAVLTPADAGPMLELADLTKPGPFGARTAELGRYVGIWQDGRLVAMAGERIRVSGHVELSAIATHPAARGRGLASRLTTDLIRAAFERGETPFLHVRAGNPAIALYRRLGFAVRREIWVLWRKPRIGERA